MLDWLRDVLHKCRGRGHEARLQALRERVGRLRPEQSLELLLRELKDGTEAPSRGNSRHIWLMALDDLAQAPAAELYGALGPGIDMPTKRPVQLLSWYFRAVGAAYTSHLFGVRWNQASQHARAEAVVMAARAARSVTKYMHLQCMCYRECGSDDWAQLGSLLTLAYENGFAPARLQPYAGDPPTTVEQEVLVALVMAVSPWSNLSPSQIYALADLLRDQRDNFRIAPTYDERFTPFAYEPASGEAPQRWSGTLPVLPGMRFFGVAAAADALRRSRSVTGTTSAAPNESASATADRDPELLDKLLDAWSLQPSIRRHPRVPRSGEVLVARDWSVIRRLVRFSELARAGHSHTYDSTNVYGLHSAPRTPLDRSFQYTVRNVDIPNRGPLANLLSLERSLHRALIDTWSLQNVSESGIGIAKASLAGWETVGMLVGYRIADSADWKLGLVKRLSCSRTGKVVLGLSSYAENFYAARVKLGVSRPGNAPRASEDGACEYDAVVAAGSDLTIFVQDLAFQSEWSYGLSLRGREDLVKFGEAIERGSNFARFRITPVAAARAA